MAKKPSIKSKSKNIAVGKIDVGKDVSGNIIVGHDNVINLSPEQIRLSSLHQLPPPPADFTGRETLIDQLLTDFNSHKGATISGLTGMGGIGKTALGLVVANQLKGKFPDAQIFLDLKGTTEPLNAVEIARHVILSFEPSADLRALNESNMHAAYQSVLHGKQVFLYFDNARSAAQISPLVPPTSCALLVTSRWTFPVAGLSVHKLGVLKEAESIDFLLEICPRIGDNATELARTCGYLPLALRIAGSFLQVNSDWGIDKYLSQLRDRKRRLEMFKQSHDDAEILEADLRATFDLSYTALSEEDRMRWRMLGVFSMSFGSSAVQAMWETDEDETTKTMGLLRRYSLLEFEENLSRFSLHDLLSDYSLSQMDAAEEQETRLKHALHYNDILSVADDLYLEGSEKILLGLRLFDLEWDHIRTAQAWVAATRSTNRYSLELCTAFPNSGTYILSLRQHPRDKIQWQDVALAAAREIGDRRGEGADLGNLGNAYADLGDAKKAIEFYERRIGIAREIGDRRGEGNALYNMGLTLEGLNEKDQAVESVRQALKIY